MKTFQYRKISLVIEFCTIFLTPQLFASPGSVESQASEEVKSDIREMNQSLERISHSFDSVETALKKPLPSTCSPSSLTGYRARLSSSAEENEEFHNAIKSIPSNIENLRSILASLDSKFSLDDVTQKERKNAIRKLIHVNLEIMNFVKKADKIKVAALPDLLDQPNQNDENKNNRLTVVQTTAETNHLLYSSLRVYAKTRSRIFGSKSISDSEKTNKELDSFYAKILSEKFTDTLNTKKHLNETAFTNGLKFLKEIVELDPLFITEYKKILKTEESNLPEKAIIKTSLDASESEYNESEKAVKKQKKALDSARSSKSDPETLKKNSAKYQQLIGLQGSLHANVRRLERYSERLEEINKTQELLGKLEKEIADNKSSQKK